MRTGVILSAFVLCVLTLSACEGGDGPRLSLAHVPSLLYRGERLTLTAQVDNRGSESRSVKVRADVRSDGPEPSQQEPPVERVIVVEGNQTAYVDISLALPEVHERPALCTVTLLADDGAQEQTAEVLVSVPDDRMPRLSVQGESLFDSEGRPVAIQLEQRLWVEDRAWAPLKWLAGLFSFDRCAPSGVVVVADVLEGADEGEGYWRALENRVASQGVRLVGWSRKGEPGALPALGLLAALSRSELAEPVEAAVLFVGSADRVVGGEPRLVRQSLEAIVQRLEAAGCSRLCIMLPIAPSAVRHEMAPYLNAVVEVAQVYKARIVNVPAWLGDASWAAGRGAGAPVYRSALSSQAQRWLFLAIVDAVKQFAAIK